MLADFRFWHITSFRCAAKFRRYWSNSGHQSILARDGLSANDPQRMYWWPQRTFRGNLPSVIVHDLPEFIWALLVITKRDLSSIRM
jgi:hypothetical protein